MIIFFIALILIVVWKARFGSFHEDYMGKSQTCALKGLFAVIIVFSHLRGYISLPSNIYNDAFSYTINFIGQLMVALFFFYSGFGIMKSYEKNNDYQKGFIKKRVVKVLVEFDVAVLLYLILSLIIGSYYDWSNYVFCWIGWKSIGNSNWFVFVILLLYVITYLSFFVIKRVKDIKKPLYLAIITTILSFSAIIVLRFVAEGSWWYDTILCYAFGMWFALIKENFDAFIKRGKKEHWGTIAVVTVLFVALYFIAGRINPFAITYNMCACAFCLLITVLTTKVKLDNVILKWLGIHSFAIYVLQRIPMIVLHKVGIANPYVFSIIAIIITMIMAYAFVKIFAITRKKINVETK
ncbi:MAG: acyltransferase [Clostridia bacterium]|nr:acyltransferase [Clostridia bacterium]